MDEPTVIAEVIELAKRIQQEGSRQSFPVANANALDAACTLYLAGVGAAQTEEQAEAPPG